MSENAGTDVKLGNGKDDCSSANRIIARIRWFTTSQVILALILVWISHQSPPEFSNVFKEIRILGVEIRQMMQSRVGITERELDLYALHVHPNYLKMPLSKLIDSGHSMGIGALIDKSIQADSATSICANESVPRERVLELPEISNLDGNYDIKSFSGRREFVFKIKTKNLVELVKNSYLWHCLLRKSDLSEFGEQLHDALSDSPYFLYRGIRHVREVDPFGNLNDRATIEYSKRIVGQSPKQLEHHEAYTLLRPVLWGFAHDFEFLESTIKNKFLSERLVLVELLMRWDRVIDGRYASAYSLIGRTDKNSHSSTEIDLKEQVTEGYQTAEKISDKMKALKTAYVKLYRIANDSEINAEFSLSHIVNVSSSGKPIRFLQSEIPRKPARIVLPIILLLFSAQLYGSSIVLKNELKRLGPGVLVTDWVWLLPRSSILITATVYMLVPFFASIYWVWRELQFARIEPYANVRYVILAIGFSLLLWFQIKYFMQCLEIRKQNLK